MQPVPFPLHDHVLSRGLVFAGEMLTKTYCCTCGLRIDQLLATPGGNCVVRPGWQGAIKFTSWTLHPAQGRA